jgi:hypothetical protein
VRVFVPVPASHSSPSRSFTSKPVFILCVRVAMLRDRAYGLYQHPSVFMAARRSHESKSPWGPHVVLKVVAADSHELAVVQKYSGAKYGALAVIPVEHTIHGFALDPNGGELSMIVMPLLEPLNSFVRLPTVTMVDVMVLAYQMLQVRCQGCSFCRSTVVDEVFCCFVFFRNCMRPPVVGLPGHSGMAQEGSMAWRRQVRELRCA